MFSCLILRYLISYHLLWCIIRMYFPRLQYELLPGRGRRCREILRHRYWNVFVRVRQVNIFLLKRKYLQAVSSLSPAISWTPLVSWALWTLSSLSTVMLCQSSASSQPSLTLWSSWSCPDLRCPLPPTPSSWPWPPATFLPFSSPVPGSSTPTLLTS